MVGYPFGDRLDRNPAPTLTIGSVSSLRRDSFGRLDRLQLDADLNPGNSGGPVIDATGAVVGIAVASVHTTDISFVIPIAKIRSFLDGRVRVGMHKIVARDGPTSRGSTRLEVLIYPQDPLLRLRRLGIAAGVPGSDPSPPPVGEPYPPVGKDLAERVLDGEDRPSPVSFTIEIPAVKGWVWLQAWYQNQRGRVALRPFRVQLDAPFAKRESVARREPAKPAPPPEPEADAVPARDGFPDLELRPPGPDRKPRSGIENEIAPVPGAGPLETVLATVGGQRIIRIPLPGSPPRMVVESTDGKALAVLHEDGTVRRITRRPWAETARLETEAPVSAMARSGDLLVLSIPSIQEILLLDAVTLEPREAIMASHPASLAVSARTPMALTHDHHGTMLHLLDLERGKTLGTLGVSTLTETFDAAFEHPGRPRSYQLRDVHLSADGTKMFLLMGSRVYRCEIRGSVVRPLAFGAPVGSWRGRIAISPDDRYLAVSGPNTRAPGHPQIDQSRRTFVYDVDDLSLPIVGIAEDGRYLAIDGRGKRVYFARVHEVVAATFRGSIKTRWQLRPKGEALGGLLLTRDGKGLVTFFPGELNWIPLR